MKKRTVFFVGLSLAAIVSGQVPCPPDFSIEKFVTSLEAESGVPVFKDLSGLKGDENAKVPVTFSTAKFTDKDYNKFMDPQYKQPHSAGVLMLFRVPNSFSMSDCGQNKVTVSENNGNNLVWPLLSVDQGKSGAGYRFQSIKGVGQTNDIEFEKGNCEHSISITARTFRLMNSPGANPIAYMAGDDFIEDFHCVIGYCNDPYGRKELGMNKAWGTLVDQNRHRLDIDVGKFYVIPAEINLDEYKHWDEGKTKIGLDYGTQAMIPVMGPFGDASIGAHVNAKVTEVINGSWAAMVGAGLGLNVQSHITGAYNPTDRRLDPSMNGAIAFGVVRGDKDGKGSTSFVVAVDDESPILKGSNYKSNTGNYFVEEQSRTAQFQHERGFTVMIKRAFGKNAVSCNWREDFRLKNGSLDMNGNNNEDFHVGCDYSRNF